MAEKQTEQSSNDSKDVGQAEVQAKFDDAQSKGYFGSTPDKTPNEDYTLKGVTSKNRK